MEYRAPKETNPYANDPTALGAGLVTYRNNCVICHGAPGVEGAALSKGLNPKPPLLVPENDLTDGDLFWIAKHGTRMTGMAAFGLTFSDEQLWKVVAFIRHLPDLTGDERTSLQAAVEKETGKEAK